MIQTCNLKTTKIEKENHLKQTSLTLRSVLIYVNFPGYGILTHPFSSISSLCRTVFSPKVRLGGRFGEVKTSSKHAVLAMNKHQGRTNETKMDTNKNENQNIHHKRRKHHGKTSFTLENLLLLGYVPCKKYLKINGNKNKTSSRRWFLDPYLGGKGNVEMVLSLRFTRNVDEKMVVFLYKRCKESNKTYETYIISVIYICVRIYHIHISYVYLRYVGDLASWLTCIYSFFAIVRVGFSFNNTKNTNPQGIIALREAMRSATCGFTPWKKRNSLQPQQKKPPSGCGLMMDLFVGRIQQQI